MEQQSRPNGRDRPRSGRRAASWLLLIGLCWPAALLPGDAGDGPAEPNSERSGRLGAANFPHSYHIDDLGLECHDCHHETSAASLETPHPAYFEDFWIECETCHRPGGGVAEPESCDACHTGGSGAADETLSAKVAIHRSCWGCHEMGTGAEASRGCGFCHEVKP